MHWTAYVDGEGSGKFSSSVPTTCEAMVALTDRGTGQPDIISFELSIFTWNLRPGFGLGGTAGGDEKNETL